MAIRGAKRQEIPLKPDIESRVEARSSIAHPNGCAITGPSIRAIIGSPKGLRYSSLSAAAGLITSACRDATKHARTPTLATVATTAAMMAGSRG